MLTLEDNMATIGTATPGRALDTPIVTTLYDLIAFLNELVEPEDDDLVTAAVVHLCDRGRMRLLATAHKL